jgi:hypothetical protein
MLSCPGRRIGQVETKCRHFVAGAWWHGQLARLDRPAYKQVGVDVDLTPPIDFAFVFIAFFILVHRPLGFPFPPR